MKPLCLYAGRSNTRVDPVRGPLRTCARGVCGGLVNRRTDCATCEKWEQRPAAGSAPKDEPPRPARKPLTVVAPCPHRSAEPVGVVECRTCAGRVELKVFGCAVEAHPTCTIAKQADAHACCATCTDRPLC